ncbi:MAG: hypothetical protein OXI96_00405 [Acidimicrobiaceae bacterium]|nr:hypothetical protein [Acidimicrobiaceae bacterium]
MLSKQNISSTATTPRCATGTTPTSPKAGAVESALKAWIIRPTANNPLALVGSTTSTSQRLDRNVEIMVEATGSDLHSTIKTAEDCWKKAWDCSEHLLEYLSQRPSPLQSSTNPESRGSTNSIITTTKQKSTKKSPRSLPLTIPVTQDLVKTAKPQPTYRQSLPLAMPTIQD